MTLGEPPNGPDASSVEFLLGVVVDAVVRLRGDGPALGFLDVRVALSASNIHAEEDLIALKTHST